ncbi:hypothetical protein APY03_1439 [Variovorax sp. WDL1]|nr:hypothetical protein APY03_1439 [Variovorax sp. WDL1]
MTLPCCLATIGASLLRSLVRGQCQSNQRCDANPVVCGIFGTPVAQLPCAARRTRRSAKPVTRRLFFFPRSASRR